MSLRCLRLQGLLGKWASAADKDERFSLCLMLAAGLVFTGCSHTPDAGEMVETAIAAHGGERYRSSVIEFDFRDKHYTVQRNGGLFSYTKTYQDSIGQIVDLLDNHGMKRTVDGVAQSLTDKEADRYASSLNSVVYFTLLPFPLNDPAARKKYLGGTSVLGESYHEIEITFAREGGGKDYRDRFVYWIHQDDHTVDYLAYRFHRDGSGTRFRQAFNRRRVNGILFADYHNFKGLPEDASLRDYEDYFQAGKLTKVSDVVVENVQVASLSN